jgi:hypothetical protein
MLTSQNNQIEISMKIIIKAPKNKTELPKGIRPG